MWRKYQTSDNKERLEWAHAVPKLDLIGTSRLDPLVVEKVVAALGFAGERQFDRDVFSKFPRQFENLADVAARSRFPGSARESAMKTLTITAFAQAVTGFPVPDAPHDAS